MRNHPRVRQGEEQATSARIGAIWGTGMPSRAASARAGKLGHRLGEVDHEPTGCVLRGYYGDQLNAEYTSKKFRKRVHLWTGVRWTVSKRRPSRAGKESRWRP